MILVVTLNPALDVTHHVPGVDWDGVNRPAATRAQAGGKGLNVARTLRTIGAQVQVIGLAGGITGEQVVSALGELGVPGAFTRIGGETRRTFAVVDTARGGTALFNEPGPAVGPDEYAEFCVRYEKALAGCSAVVLSGSLPRGLPADTYAELGAMAAAAGCRPCWTPTARRCAWAWPPARLSPSPTSRSWKPWPAAACPRRAALTRPRWPSPRGS